MVLSYSRNLCAHKLRGQAPAENKQVKLHSSENTVYPGVLRPGSYLPDVRVEFVNRPVRFYARILFSNTGPAVQAGFSLVAGTCVALQQALPGENVQQGLFLIMAEEFGRP